MTFRSTFALAALYVDMSQKYFPTNIMARWMRQPGHLRFAWPLSVCLYAAYYGVARWIDSIPATETSGWLQLALVVACVDALKFACGAVVWPIMGAYRRLRRMMQLAKGDARRSQLYCWPTAPPTLAPGTGWTLPRRRTCSTTRPTGCSRPRSA